MADSSLRQGQVRPRQNGLRDNVIEFAILYFQFSIFTVLEKIKAGKITKLKIENKKSKIANEYPVV
jgi:hypothetical protein